MKILYALQATGNGHVSRANDILPILASYGDLDVLVSGTQSNIPLEHPITYRKKGLSFHFGKNGGIDYVQTARSIQTRQFLQEIKTLPVEKYDLVINDFEPLSAWAARQKQVPCIALSHQYAVISPKAPRPAYTDPLAWMILKHFAPSDRGVGFHFQSFEDHILTPVIRAEIKHAYIRNLGHYTVYLPAYSDEKLIQLLSAFPDKQWHIFSRKAKTSYASDNCWIRPIDNHDFISSFTGCEGILTGAGFETPAEALYMGKKLMSIPMKGQYEQQCNAAALQKMGVPVLKSLKEKNLVAVRQWLNSPMPERILYPDVVESALNRVFTSFKSTRPVPTHEPMPLQPDFQILNQAAIPFAVRKV